VKNVKKFAGRWRYVTPIEKGTADTVINFDRTDFQYLVPPFEVHFVIRKAWRSSEGGDTTIPLRFPYHQKATLNKFSSTKLGPRPVGVGLVSGPGFRTRSRCLVTTESRVWTQERVEGQLLQEGVVFT